jgi:hypothetical protein
MSGKCSRFSSCNHGESTLFVASLRNPSYRHGGRLIVTEMGNFTLANGMQLNDDEFKAGAIKRRMNMQGIRLKVMAVLREEIRVPFEDLLYEHDEPLRDSMTRFTFSLVEIIREMFNLT